MGVWWGCGGETDREIHRHRYLAFLHIYTRMQILFPKARTETMFAMPFGWVASCRKNRWLKAVAMRRRSFGDQCSPG